MIQIYTGPLALIDPILHRRRYFHLQYMSSQRHSVIGHCDGRVIHLGDFDIFFVLINIFSKFLLHLECCYKRHIKISIQIEQSTGYIGITRSDTSVAVICRVVSLTVLLLDNQSINIVTLFLAEPNHSVQVINGHNKSIT